MAKPLKDEINDIFLTRYVCYLIAQNGDSRKEQIASEYRKQQQCPKFAPSNYFPYLYGVIMRKLALKGKFSILTVAIAAFLLLAFTAVPHHHHGAMMCMTTEHHDEAHNHDEGHACAAHHGDGEEHTDANNHCVAEVEYLVSAQQEINGKHFSCTLHHPPFPLLPALFVWINFSDDFVAAPFGSKHKYRSAVFLIKSADAGQIHGLRAPPFIS
jgi:hypothetical protein